MPRIIRCACWVGFHRLILEKVTIDSAMRLSAQTMVGSWDALKMNGLNAIHTAVIISTTRPHMTFSQG